MPYLGRLPSPPDGRDFRLAALIAPERQRTLAERLPWRYVDRSMKRYPARQDQHENSCVGRSTSLAKLIQERKDHRRTIEFDALWLWQAAKQADGIGDPGADRGTYIRTALDVLHHQGAKPSQSTAPPDRFVIDSYYRLESVDETKLAIRHFGPVITGTTWYEAWFGTDVLGRLPMPDRVAGGHATAYYGWDDRLVFPWSIRPDGTFTDSPSIGGFLAANSWGDDWGIGGDYWIPYVAFGYGRPVDEAWKAVDVIGERW